jgi:hypothetical protein
MGTFDIVGAYDEEVGADDAGNTPAQVQAKSLPIHFAGAGPNTIGASGSSTFTFNLNMALRPDKFVIPEAVAPSVVVNSINIGAISLNASADPAPGDMFRHHSTGRLRGAVSGSPSVPIKATLTNTTTTAIAAVYLGLQGPCKRVN